MVRPANFGFNEETAASNAFQSRNGQLLPDEVSRLAQAAQGVVVAVRVVLRWVRIVKKEFPRRKWVGLKSMQDRWIAK